MEADIKMRENSIHNTELLDNGQTDFYCHNLNIFNEVLNINDNTMGSKYKSCIGVWKIKQPVNENNSDSEKLNN
jgi:hypothetical protein